jgi:hypothetical protein
VTDRADWAFHLRLCLQLLILELLRLPWSPQVRVTFLVTQRTDRLAPCTRRGRQLSRSRGHIGFGGSALGAVVDVDGIILWPGGVELAVDELDDAVRSRLTDNRDRRAAGRRGSPGPGSRVGRVQAGEGRPNRWRTW